MTDNPVLLGYVTKKEVSISRLFSSINVAIVFMCHMYMSLTSTKALVILPFYNAEVEEKGSKGSLV